MPSGDVYQSAFFLFVMWHLGADLKILVIFTLLVCLGRVYFMCHWVLDTVVGTILGLLTGYAYIHWIYGFLLPILVWIE